VYFQCVCEGHLASRSNVKPAGVIDPDGFSPPSTRLKQIREEKLEYVIQGLVRLHIAPRISQPVL